MNDFDDLVSSERRKQEAQAAAERVRNAESEARREAWERDELRAWQTSIERMQDLFTAATRRLEKEDVRPLPVLEHRPPPPRPAGLESVNRTVITGYRWQFEIFALDKRCRAYKVAVPRPLMDVDRRSEWSIKERTVGYLLRGKGLGSAGRLQMLTGKSLLRTGLNPADLVLWGGSTDRVELDPVTAVRTGRIHCFGKSDDGTPLVFVPDSQPEALETFLARGIGRLLAQR